LDIGTGTGRFAIPLSGTANVVGIDNSLDMLRRARKKKSKAERDFVLVLGRRCQKGRD